MLLYSIVLVLPYIDLNPSWVFRMGNTCTPMEECVYFQQVLFLEILTNIYALSCWFEVLSVYIVPTVVQEGGKISCLVMRTLQALVLLPLKYDVHVLVMKIEKRDQHSPAYSQVIVLLGRDCYNGGNSEDGSKKFTVLLLHFKYNMHVLIRNLIIYRSYFSNPVSLQLNFLVIWNYFY